MCLYMSVPLWINVERLTTAVSATASQLFDVSLVIFLLNCKSSKAAVTAKPKTSATVAIVNTASTAASSPVSSSLTASLALAEITTATLKQPADCVYKQLKQNKHQQQQ